MLKDDEFDKVVHISCKIEIFINKHKFVVELHLWTKAPDPYWETAEDTKFNELMFNIKD